MNFAPVAPAVQRVSQGKASGPVHVLTSPVDRKVNGMAFAATKCFQNMVGNGTFQTSVQPATCPTCTKV